MPSQPVSDQTSGSTRLAILTNVFWEKSEIHFMHEFLEEHGVRNFRTVFIEIYILLHVYTELYMVLFLGWLRTLKNS